MNAVVGIEDADGVVARRARREVERERRKRMIGKAGYGGRESVDC